MALGWRSGIFIHSDFRIPGPPLKFLSCESAGLSLGCIPLLHHSRVGIYFPRFLESWALICHFENWEFPALLVIGSFCFEPLECNPASQVANYSPVQPLGLAWKSSIGLEFLQCRGSFRVKPVLVCKAPSGFLPSRWWFYFWSLWGLNFKNFSRFSFYSSGIPSLIMDPSWSNIKHILRRHEDMAEGSRVNFNQVISKVSSIEQLIMTLLQ